MSLTPRERDRLDALVAAYRRLPQVEPPAALDAAVRAHARAALRPAKPRWPGLLATAATMTIAIGLAWQLNDAEDVRETQRPGAASVPEPQRTSAEVLEDGPVASSDAGRHEQHTKAAESPESNRALDELAESTAPEAPPAATERKPNADATAPEESRARAAIALPRPITEIEQSPQPSTEPPSRSERHAPLESSAAPAPPPARRSATAPPPAAIPAPAAVPAAPSAVAPPVAKRDTADTRDEPPDGRLARDEADAFEERQTAPGARADAGLGAASAAREPQDWLDEITRLLRTGQRARAIESLREFRDAHPDAELPPELAELLP